MDIRVRYVVYELNRIMGSERHLALEEVKFSGITSNWFETEEDAVKALVEDKKMYEDYVILKQVYIN
jgi:hypothetical protein